MPGSESRAATSPSLWRDLGVSLSLVNLLYLGVWEMILPLDATQSYYLPGGALSPSFFVRPVAGCVVAGLVLCTLGRAVRLTRRPILRAFARGAFLFLALCALNAVRHLAPSLWADRVATVIGWTGIALGTAAASFVATLALLHWPRDAVRGVSVVLLLCLPFFAITTVHAFRNAASCRSLEAGRFADREYRAPSREPQPPDVRVVMLVFDEMDQRYLPPAAASRTALPALEALQDTALWTDKAVAPADRTMLSMPAMLSGMRVSVARTVAPDELELTLAGDRAVVPWSAQPNPFKAARALGHKVGLVGWFVPYCRLFGEDLASCAWFSHVPNPEVGLAEDVLRQAVLVGEKVPGVARFELLDRLELPRTPHVPPEWHLRQYLQIHERALGLVCDPRYGLVFLHYPIPHKPFIYSRVTATMPTPDRSYDGNLALADHALGELRERMTAEGIWHDSIFLLTSDHGWRQLPGSAVHVPFALKMPGQTRPLHYSRAVDTIVMADLLTELLSGRLKNADAVATWLDGRGGAAPDPAPIPPSLRP